MNEIMISDPFAQHMANMSNMFRNLEAMMDFDFGKESKGLRKYLNRPHNLITKKNDKGEVVGYRIELPYTPFAKDEVNVEVKDGNLIVTCGTENKIRDEEMDFSSISYKNFSFSLPLSDSIDFNNITANANDGMLRIDLPTKVVEEKHDTLKIEVK